MLSDAFLGVGFLLIVVGVGLILGLGWAALVAGVLLFGAGGAASRRESR